MDHLDSYNLLDEDLCGALILSATCPENHPSDSEWWLGAKYADSEKKGF